MNTKSSIDRDLEDKKYKMFRNNSLLELNEKKKEN